MNSEKKSKRLNLEAAREIVQGIIAKEIQALGVRLPQETSLGCMITQGHYIFKLAQSAEPVWHHRIFCLCYIDRFTGQTFLRSFLPEGVIATDERVSEAMEQIRTHAGILDDSDSTLPQNR